MLHYLFDDGRAAGAEECQTRASRDIRLTPEVVAIRVAMKHH